MQSRLENVENRARGVVIQPSRLCFRCLSSEATGEVPSAGSMCDECFCGMVERRVKRKVRREFPFSPGESVVVIDDGSLNAAVMKHMLPLVVGGLPLKMSVIQKPRGEVPFPKNAGKVLVPLNGSDVAHAFLGWLTKGIGMDKQGIPFLGCVTDAEVAWYARSKRVVGEIQVSQPRISGFDGLEKKYPGLTMGLLKSAKIFL